MADPVSFSLVGLEALEEKLAIVADDVQTRGGRFALRKAAQVVRDKARERAQEIDDPETAKNTALNIVERWSGRDYRKTGMLTFRVGVRGGAGGSKKGSELSGLPGGDTRNWRMVEFGTQHMPAQPFMRPALSESISEATNTFVTQYEKALGRAIKRAKKAENK